MLYAHVQAVLIQLSPAAAPRPLHHGLHHRRLLLAIQGVCSGGARFGVSADTPDRAWLQFFARTPGQLPLSDGVHRGSCTH